MQQSLFLSKCLLYLDYLIIFTYTIENENETKMVHSDELNYPTNLNKWIKICFMLEFED